MNSSLTAVGVDLAVQDRLTGGHSGGGVGHYGRRLRKSGKGHIATVGSARSIGGHHPIMIGGVRLQFID